jgi:hypothetical protein
MPNELLEKSISEARGCARITIGISDALRLRTKIANIKRAALNARDENVRIAREADESIQLLDLIIAPVSQS